MNFLFGPTPSILIALDDEDNRPKTRGKDEKGDDAILPLFTQEDTVAGNVIIDPIKPMEHVGIKVELIGQIELTYERSAPYEFTSLVRELEPAGILEGKKSYPFEFSKVDKQYETFNGSNVRLRFFIRVKISRKFAANIVVVKELAVQNVVPKPEGSKLIKMEVGIEDCLHIEFEYAHNKFHLNDVVVGKIYFLLVRIKIKHMEMVIVKRESTGNGGDVYNENVNIAKFEIMDGAPVRGETIPLRLFLSPHRLSPTMKNVHNKFSVKYFLNLVLVDEEDRRYFKQQEIQLWRKELDTIDNESTC